MPAPFGFSYDRFTDSMPPFAIFAWREEANNHDEEDHFSRSYRGDRRGPVATRRMRDDAYAT
ncbi:hypothetical protein BCEN4_1130012 [Burkholderia cenocepacia]|nr:hypothetical protein BCEN4_1130012 [Burkholderia cenocepacia]